MRLTLFARLRFAAHSLAAGLALALLAGGSAFAATTIPGGMDPATYIITSPGDYNLGGTRTHTLGTANSIEIKSSNVRLFLRGFTIQATQSNRTQAGIKVGPGTAMTALTNICISGPGTIKHFADGVRVQNHVHNLLVTRLTLTDNKDGVCSDAGSDDLVNHTYSYNNASWNKDDGFQVDGRGHHFCYNTANYNGDNGFELCVHDTELTCNVANYNGANGFYVRGCANIFWSNTAFYNKYDGINLVGDDNGLAKNKTSSNGNDGIEIGSSSYDNVLKYNVAYNNNTKASGGVDFRDVGAAHPYCPNAWSINQFNTDNEAGANQGPGAGCIQ